MLNFILKPIVFYSILAFSISGSAALTAGARYFKGTVKVNTSQPSDCFVEILYSSDAAQITARAILTLPHLSQAGELVWLAIGPYNGSYLPAKSLYRYQDTTTAAPVKDMVVNTVGQTTPTKLAILYWHAGAGHHDPIFCEELVESITPEQLTEADEIFTEFEVIKANNP